MQSFKTLSDAIALAEFAHRNQVDKAGLPYIEHPRRVMEKVKAQGGLPYVHMAAILHDVTEDTAFTPQMLLELGVPISAVKIIRLVDRDYSLQTLLDNYKENYKSLSKELSDKYYYEQIAKDPGAKVVKMADIEDNLSEWRLSYLDEATQTRLRKKYAKAKEILGRDR